MNMGPIKPWPVVFVLALMLTLINFPLDALAGQGIGVKMGISSGRLTQEQTAEEFVFTGKSRRELLFSGIKTNGYFIIEQTARFALAAGLVNVSTFDTQSSSRSIKTGVYIAPTFVVAGSPRKLEIGKGPFRIDESGRFRLLIPVSVGLMTYDFEPAVESQVVGGASRKFKGSSLTLDIGSEAEYDISQLFTLGAGISFVPIGFSAASPVVNEFSFSAHISLMRAI